VAPATTAMHVSHTFQSDGPQRYPSLNCNRLNLLPSALMLAAVTDTELPSDTKCIRICLIMSMEDAVLVCFFASLSITSWAVLNGWIARARARRFEEWSEHGSSTLD
jgi:hypothetical protein